jgi:hypothetical protein
VGHGSTSNAAQREELDLNDTYRSLPPSDTISPDVGPGQVETSVDKTVISAVTGSLV